MGQPFETALSSLLDPDAAWMQGLQAAPGHPLTNARGVGIGAVLAVLRPNPLEVLVVQKADVDGFEFSGMWSMPGGMVRCSESSAENPDPLLLLANSLSKRVQLECGISGVTAAQLSPVVILPPPVTRYTAKGMLRHTVVLPFLFTGPEPLHLVASDRSVRNPQWMKVDEALRATAPANRLILASLVWPSLTKPERNQLTPDVNAARQQCNSWAAEVGLSPTQGP